MRSIVDCLVSLAFFATLLGSSSPSITEKSPSASVQLRLLATASERTDDYDALVAARFWQIYRAASARSW